MNNSAFVKVAAYRAMDLLNERRALISPDGIAFWAWVTPSKQNNDFQ